MQEEAQKQEESQKSKKGFWRTFWKSMLWLIVLLLLLCILVSTIVQNKRFQNWAIDKVTHSLSERLDTEVSLDSIGIEFFDNLTFENFYIQGYDADTLISVKQLNVDFDLSLKKIWDRDFTINEIYLDEGMVKLNRDSSDYFNNIQLFLKKLEETNAKNDKDNSNKESKPINLDLQYISLKNVMFVQQDGLRGQDMHAKVLDGKIFIDAFDISENLFNISSVAIDGFNLDIDEFDRNDEKFNRLWDEKFMNQLNGIKENDQVSREVDSTPQEEMKPLVISAKSISLINGNFTLNNTRYFAERRMPTNTLDYKHLDVSDINAQINNFNFTICEFTGQLESFSCQEDSGLTFENAYCNDFLVTDKKVALNGMQIKTPHSTFGDTLVLKYKEFLDWPDFQDKVRMDVRLNNSVIGMKDIVYFAGMLQDNSFVQKNIEENLYIDGRILGRLNSLGARDLTMKLGDNLVFKGSLRSNNITKKDEEFFDLKIDYLTSDIFTLRELIPGFNPPKQFDSFGNLDFGGTFFGFLHDFTAKGQLNCNLGQINSDMKLVLLENKQDAEYSGNISFTDFDLGTWADDPKLGKITLSANVAEGRGVNRDNASAKLKAVVETFTYQDYVYNNVTFNGELNRNRLNGSLDIKDDNIDLDFDGDINFEDVAKGYNFRSKINKLDLRKLNLSKKDIALSGNFDLSIIGNSIADIKGKASVLDLELVLDDSISYQMDTVNLISKNIGEDKYFDLESDLFDATLQGDFVLDKFPFAIQDYIIGKFSSYAERLGVKTSGKEFVPHDFSFDIDVKDSENLTNFVHPKLDTIKNTKISGYLDNVRDTFYLDAEFPTFKFDQIELNKVTILAEANEQASDFQIGVLEPIIQNKNEFPSVMLNGTLEDDIVYFHAGLSNFKQKQLDQMILRGELFAINDNDFEVRFEPSNLTFFGESWNIPDNNYVRFGKDFIDTENFIIESEGQKIVLESEGQKGLNLLVENIDVAKVNQFINYHLLDFGGKFNVKGSAKNVFTMEDLELEVAMDTFLIITTHTDTTVNDWGKFNFTAKSSGIDSRIATNLTIGYLEEEPSRVLQAKGFYIPPNIKHSKFAANYFEQQVEITDYPLDLISYFIPSGISEMSGKFDANCKLYGLPSAPQIDGEANVFDGGVKIDYLGTRYSFAKGNIKLNNEMIDATGEKIFDKNGNPATLFGGIRHKHLKNLLLDLDIITDNDRFLALDTKKGDNDLFYGVGIGKGSVEFRGPFTQTDINIDVATSDSTQVTIPLEDSNEGQELSFIRFVNRNKKEETFKEEKNELRGVNIALNMEITDAADVRLLFDEKAGDIVKGKGFGNINIDVKRTGEFSMYGDYIIEEGEYLFTYSYRDILRFNKPFQVKRGGSIVWSGDPYDAKIDLEAEYKDLKTSTYNLIAENLETVNESVKAEARATTPVNLSMFLKGDLFKPDITFRLGFPELTGEIKAYVESKMRVLEQDENELNRQVFGLMVIGGFLPNSEGALGGDEVVNFGVNTFSQFVSNQLSLYISDFLSDVITDEGIYSGAEFDVDYRVYDPGDLQSITRQSEVSLQLKNYLFNDRVAIQIGTDFGVGSAQAGTTSNTSAFNTIDVIVEWVIAKDRRFKLVFYNKNELILGGQREKRGVGIKYRYEFDTFQEFLKGFRKKTKDWVKR